MRILKYGEGYEPKVVICEHCKSEIEYFDIEAQPFSDYYQGANGEIWYSFPDQDCIFIQKKGIKCPVCNRFTSTSEELLGVYTLEQETKPKKRWWQR